MCVASPGSDLGRGLRVGKGLGVLGWGGRTWTPQGCNILQRLIEIKSGGGCAPAVGEGGIHLTPPPPPAWRVPCCKQAQRRARFWAELGIGGWGGVLHYLNKSFLMGAGLCGSVRG